MENIVKVADGIYANTHTVVENLVLDILSKLKTCKVNIYDLNGRSNYSYVYVKDDKVMRQTWDETYHGSSITDDKYTELTSDPEDVEKIKIIKGLYKIYK